MMKRLGDYIRPVDVRNRDLKVTRLVGLTIDKAFIPSVANTIGTDLSNYKVISENQFACSLMQVSRDGKMPIAMFKGEPCIMSPAYPMFEVSKTDELLPEYLMMWFSRSEFDREASFYAVGGVRGSLEWNDFCDMQIPVPAIEKQRETVAEYNTLATRIETNKKLIATLEQTAQTLYRHTFVDNIDPNNLPDGWRMGTVGEFCAKMTSGGTPSRTNNDYWNSKDYPWLKTGEVQNNVIFETEEYISEAGLKNSSAKLIPTGSVVMAMYGATAAQVGYLQCETTTNQACCNMICKSEVDAAFLYFHFLVNQEEIKRLATGGAQENLSQDVISAQPILIVDDNSVKQAFSAIMQKFVCCFKEIKILTQTQTLLLSKMGA
ncbi:MAG: restriction endonuclease subunit S [Eubacteriales bacterium]|nr:restriction endonuclease subunit S [Eubacteriales bacterium]